MSRYWLRIGAFIISVLGLCGAAAADAGTGAGAHRCHALVEAKDYVKAVPVCKAAAEQGDPEAQFNMSLLSASGLVGSEDVSDVLKWLKASADQRFPPAEYALAFRYMKAMNVPKDGRKAARLLRDAGRQGFVPAEMLLGRAYEAGHTQLAIKPDIRVAAGWYRKAAKRCGACHYELWRVYYFGLGVDKDDAQAAVYLKEAANAGLPKAQTQLGFRYMKGEGVPKTNVRAYKWFHIAAEGGQRTATSALSLVSKDMSAAEIAEAKSSAAETMDKRAINTRQLCEIYRQFCGR